jgi:murein DD-endopeptidase MepM/ murein hydrolase activator NlpD
MLIFQTQSGAMAKSGAGAARRGVMVAIVACCALIGASAALLVTGPIKLRSAKKPKKFIPIQAVPALAAKMASQTIQAGTPSPTYDNAAEPQVQPAIPLRVVKLTLDRPVSISGLLRDAGVDAAQRDAWADAFRSSAHWGILNPGHQVSVFKDPGTGSVRALEYDIDDNSVIREESLGNGVVFATRQPLIYQPETVAYTLSLADGLDAAAARKHLPDSVVQQIKYAFATRLPRLDTRGTLKLVYKELVTPDGAHHRSEDLQACKIQSGRRTYSAFAFNDGHGREHLYDEHGNPLEPQFLRFPLAFQYISSSFSPSRYHPILHRYRAHVGIDLAARYGTPVRAISDGTVQFANWDGELGRCIRIQHKDSLISVYAHLSAISPLITPGAPVRIGQVIGFVGSSGLSTGPHLHYALYKDGRFLDPLKVNLDGGGAAISGDRWPLFDAFRRSFERVFARLHSGTADVAVKDPVINRVEAYNADAEPPMPFSIPAVDSVPGSLTIPSSARTTPRPQVHLTRGGLLRDRVPHDTSSAALDRLIDSGLIGDPGM